MSLGRLNKADWIEKLDDRCTNEFRNGSCVDEGANPRIHQELPSQALYTAIQEE